MTKICECLRSVEKNNEKYWYHYIDNDGGRQNIKRYIGRETDWVINTNATYKITERVKKERENKGTTITSVLQLQIYRDKSKRRGKIYKWVEKALQIVMGTHTFREKKKKTKNKMINKCKDRRKKGVR